MSGRVQNPTYLYNCMIMNGSFSRFCWVNRDFLPLKFIFSYEDVEKIFPFAWEDFNGQVMLKDRICTSHFTWYVVYLVKTPIFLVKFMSLCCIES